MKFVTNQISKSNVLFLIVIADPPMTAANKQIDK